MPTIQLTFDQVVEAVRQLPEGDRRRLLSAVGLPPKGERPRAVAGRLRKKYQAKPKQQKRMSEPLVKGSAGTLTAEENRELNLLVEDYERRTVEMANGLAATFGIVDRPVESRSP
jgi:hypothetical protein